MPLGKADEFHYVIDTRNGEKILLFSKRLDALDKVREFNKIYFRDKGLRPFDILSIDN